MPILITGITGFIGSNLAKRLVGEGEEVYGLVRHSSRADLRPLEPILDKVRFVEGDLCEYHSVRSAIVSTRPNAVIHLGAITPVRHSYEDPFPYAKVNFDGTMNVAHAIIETSPHTKLIAASTAEVYGWQPQTPIGENAQLNPASPYAVSKAAADAYLRMAMKVYGLKATVMRCNNTYGRIRERGFISEYIISSMLADQPVYIGAPSHVRDYMIVDDHVAAYLRALKSEAALGETFNVSPGNPITNLELAAKIAQITGFKGKIIEGSYPPGYPVRPTQWDTEYIVLKNEKISSKLGWKPSVSLDEGLRRTVDAWRVTEVAGVSSERPQK